MRSRSPPAKALGAKGGQAVNSTSQLKKSGDLDSAPPPEIHRHLRRPVRLRRTVQLVQASTTMAQDRPIADRVRRGR
jgi:hypothetical protein